MEASVVTMTPDLAEEILTLNLNNRKLSKNNDCYITHHMKAGSWLENGESIIIGRDGRLKDGQHRLFATIKTGCVWDCVLVTGVKSDVMPSIDTGRNRTASDVLELNGFMYSVHMASLVKAIILGRNSNDKSGVTPKANNQTILAYANENTDYLYDLIRGCMKSYQKQETPVFSITELAYVLHKISGENNTFSNIHIDFINKLCGVNASDSSSISWFRTTLCNQKKKKITPMKKWKWNGIIKCWNLFKDGDIPVNYLRIDVDRDEKIELI